MTSLKGLINHLILATIMLSCIISCVPMKSIFLCHPDKKDASRFDSKTTYPQKRNFKFERLPENQLIKVNDWTSDLPEFNTLKSSARTMKFENYSLLRKTQFFLIIKTNYRKNYIAPTPCPNV